MPESDQQPSTATDALVVAARSDREAFGRLYEAYYDRVFGYCLRRLSQRTAAEDVCSDTFLYVARKISSFHGQTEQDFRRWVYRIATNEVNAHLRRNLRRKELWDEALREQRVGASSPTNPAETDEGEAWSLVRRAIARLTPKEQTIVTLRLLESLPHDEIACVLNVRPGAVRVAYSRAIKKLRERLSGDVVGSNNSLTRRG